MLITPSIKEHQLDTNQLRHQLGTNQFVIKIAEEYQIVPTLELSTFVVPTIDMYEGTISLVEGASDSVDPPFHLTLYRDLSPALTMFLMIQLWI